jgi:acetoin utilization deacetylase AcuC-like enzyme
MPMPFFYTTRHALHAPKIEFDQGHPGMYCDVPERIEKIYKRLSTNEMFELSQIEINIPVDDLLKVHSEKLVTYLSGRSASITLGKDYIFPEIFPIRQEMSSIHQNFRFRDGCFAFDNFSPIGVHTWKAALSAASVSAAGAKSLLNHKQSAYALTRPPGHHAGPDFIGGYCYLNNAAIAAGILKSLGKVAIIDLDYHHGNGTQSIFWGDPQVFFGSIHADPTYEYPYYSGWADERGGDGAVNTNRNYPLPIGTVGRVYLEYLTKLLEEINQFQPEAIVVSIGFDTYIHDKIGKFNLKAEDYDQAGTLLAELGLPTLFVQEGGYDVRSIANLAEVFLSGFLRKHLVS